MLHSLTLLTQSRRREGLTNFPWQSLSASAYRVLVPRPPCEAECSLSSPSAASPGRPSTLRTPIANIVGRLCHAQHAGDVCTRLSATCQPGAASIKVITECHFSSPYAVPILGSLGNQLLASFHHQACGLIVNAGASGRRKVVQGSSEIAVSPGGSAGLPGGQPLGRQCHRIDGQHFVKCYRLLLSARGDTIQFPDE
jgi:hypothetical protein